MDIEFIRKAVNGIEEGCEDDEMAHLAEDDLRRTFIEYVAAAGSEELAAMAKEILKTEDIEFARWCA